MEPGIIIFLALSAGVGVALRKLKKKAPQKGKKLGTGGASSNITHGDNSFGGHFGGSGGGAGGGGGGGAGGGAGGGGVGSC